MIDDYIIRTFCIQKYCLEKAYMLYWMLPLFILLLFLIYRNFIKFKNEDERKKFNKNNLLLRIIMLLSRTLIILLLLFSLARPFTTEEAITQGHPVIKILVDSTESMNIFSKDLLKSLEQALGNKVPVDIRQISSGKKSELGEGILKNIEGKDNLLLITDGNNNFGKGLTDVAIYSGISDTRLFALDISPEKSDSRVEISGPSETIEGTLNKFNIKVSYIGGEPSFTLQVYIDDRLEFTGQNVFEKEILKNFPKGSHKITAKIILADFFEQNNVFYKSVKSVPKPRVLFIAKKNSPLKEGLEDIYDLDYSQSLASDLKRYSAIVFDDIPYSDIQNRLEDLTGFLLDGNGIVFIGGRNSFDKGNYKDTMLESMLPVKMGTGKIIDPFKHNIIIVMDVSDSFSDYSYKAKGQNSVLDLQKAMVIKMIGDFRDDITVGLVAFATTGRIISEPVELKDNRLMLIDRIKHIRGGEGTQLSQGLLYAQTSLNTVKGTKNVIMVSDGKMNRGFLGEDPSTLNKATQMAQSGIKIYTVGMPSLISQQTDIDRKFLSHIAEIGGGNYFEPTEAQYLNVFFGKPEAKEKIFSGNSNLAIIDKEHFITRDLKINAMLTGINFVVPKSGSRSLAFTGDGNPVLNSWNFGLGRVVTLATDDGSDWASSLLTKENSMLITRMINYAVGSPEKGKEIYVDAGDSFLGETNEVTVKSAKYPSSDVLTFTKQGSDVYKASFSPEKEGFYQFFDRIAAVNPPKEYYSLGMNPELKGIVEISGGKMLKPDDKTLLSQIQSLTKRKETIKKELLAYPLGIALLIFMIEIIIRKIYEYKRFQVKLK
jgi:uncharacterized membrane protein